MEYRTYRVLRADRQPLLDFVVASLESCGCRIIRRSEANEAPFRLSFEDPHGQRQGILVYGFLANTKLTKNRPDDEHRFQVKYGSDDRREHDLAQDPYGLYTTLFCGIDPERGFFVGADPVLHSPTRFFKSIEFKTEKVDEIARRKWISWERDHRAEDDKPVEVLVGGTADHFLRYIQFEREALGEDQGHRQLLAEQAGSRVWSTKSLRVSAGPRPSGKHLHSLAVEFEMSEKAVLDLIARARMLKMAVRGWVAEEHLVRALRKTRGVEDCTQPHQDGRPDVSLRFEGTPLTVECKNVLRKTTKTGLARVDLQRTRSSKNDPCSRYYSSKDFDVVAACLHAVTERWEFSYVVSGELPKHGTCRGKLSNNVKIDEQWNASAETVLRAAAGT